MKSFYPLFGAATLALMSGSALSAELYLNTFLGSNPLKDLEVELDGRLLGTTDANGAVSGELKEGAHVLRVLEKRVPLTEYRFELAPGQSADLSLTFTDFAQPPAANIEKYDPATAAQGAPGLIEGTVSDGEGKPLAGAVVHIEPANLETVTDESGRFSLQAPRGIYELSIRADGYQTVSTTGLRVAAGVGTAMNATLNPEAVQEIGGGSSSGKGADGVEEIVVTGSYKPRSTPAGIERFSVAVTDAISVEELVRAGDTDVAASLRRLVGVSVTGGRYAVVRGLDGRYIAATLNGNLLPSTDPFRRDVQLDLFPSDILGGIEVQKSFSADMPGDTTGGIIKIATRDIPDQYVNRLSVSGGFVSGVTGKGLVRYRGGDGDEIGYDDGIRELPGDVDRATNGGLNFRLCQVEGQTGCVSQVEAARLASLLPNIYKVKEEKAAPKFGAAYSLGNSFDLDIGRVGVYGVATYDNSNASRQDASVDNVTTRSTYQRDTFNTALTGYLVAGIESVDGWTATSKTLFLHDSEDNTTFESGFDKNEDNNFDRILLEWIERQLISQQLLASVPLFDTHKLDLHASISQTTRMSPDRRTYNYLGGSLVVSSVERSYSDLTEDAIDAGVDYTLPIEISDSVNSNIKFGGLYDNRDRNNDLVRLGLRTGNRTADLTQDVETLLSFENFANDSFRLRGTSTLTDTYVAEQETAAGYLSTETNFGESFTVVAGARQDNFKQSLSFPNDTTSAVSLKSNELLPSLGTIYRYGDDLQVRANYAMTVSRPNITELAPSRFFDDKGREHVGCPTCTASTIDNYDLRVEYYFSREDSISFALFYKDITNPLERSVADGSGSATNALTFRNNEGATVKGLELDGNKSFLFAEAHQLSLGANVSFIESKIELDDVGRRLESNDSRKLQGQSPFLANMRIGYDHFPTSQKATLVINYFDDRIDIVTRAPQAPIFEAGRATVNLTYEKEFANLSKLSFRIENLLDAKVRFVQADKTIESWANGIEFTMGYSYNF